MDYSLPPEKAATKSSSRTSSGYEKSVVQFYSTDSNRRGDRLINIIDLNYHNVQFTPSPRRVLDITKPELGRKKTRKQRPLTPPSLKPPSTSLFSICLFSSSIYCSALVHLVIGAVCVSIWDLLRDIRGRVT
jgi:hypothetical protein